MTEEQQNQKILALFDALTNLILAATLWLRKRS